MGRMSRPFYNFAAASLIALLAACTRGAGGAGGPQHVLRIAYAGDPASLVPFVAIDQDIIALDTLFCQTLVGLSSENQDVPILVTRIPSRRNGDVSPDGTRITYHLRPDARFADGVPLTSADVAFTYRAIFDPRNRATSIEPYRRVVSLRTPDAAHRGHAAARALERRRPRAVRPGRLRLRHSAEARLRRHQDRRLTLGERALRHRTLSRQDVAARRSNRL